jgi:hypothetical protein
MNTTRTPVVRIPRGLRRVDVTPALLRQLEARIPDCERADLARGDDFAACVLDQMTPGSEFVGSYSLKHWYEHRRPCLGYLSTPRLTILAIERGFPLAADVSNPDYYIGVDVECWRSQYGKVCIPTGPLADEKRNDPWWGPRRARKKLRAR